MMDVEPEDKTGLTLDEIIQRNNIQAPASSSSLVRRLANPYSQRGGGFAKPALPRDFLAARLKSDNDIINSAFQAGVASALNFHNLRGGFPLQRQGILRGGFQRGGFQSGGFNPQRWGIHPQRRPFNHRGSFNPRGLFYPRSGFYPRGNFHRGRFLRGGFQQRGLHRGDLENVEITVDSACVADVKAPLRDRLGWYPWQQLTPGQQVARNKLALAKSRLTAGRPQRAAARAFACGMLRGRQTRIDAARVPRFRNKMALAALVPPVPGVSPLLRQNVARLPGHAGSAAPSVHSFSARSHTSHVSRSRPHKLANQRYLSERQFDGGAGPSGTASVASLQARLRPAQWFGAHNQQRKHVVQLDYQLQAEIDALQKMAPPAPTQDFEYRAVVVPTLTSTTDRFGLMMTL